MQSEQTKAAEPDRNEPRQAQSQRPRERQSIDKENPRDLDERGEAIVGGAPGKPIDDVGGPGLGVRAGDKNSVGKSGASGSTEA